MKLQITHSPRHGCKYNNLPCHGCKYDYLQHQYKYLTLLLLGALLKRVAIENGLKHAINVIMI